MVGGRLLLACSLLALSSALLPSRDPEDLLQQLDLPEPISEVEGLLGREVQLPCDVNASGPGDSASMVLWFRDGQADPFYSFDARSGDFSAARLWSSAAVFGARATFHTSPPLAHLLLSAVQLGDAGLFRCRVDFRDSPTRNSKVNLTVVVPPGRPEILDPRQEEYVQQMAPVDEGSALDLLCDVSGGSPAPKVVWFLDESPIDDSYELLPNAHTVNRLHLPRVGRQLQGSRLVCAASNTRLRPAVQRELFVAVNLRPVAVQIVPREAVFSAGRPHQVMCSSSGSRPEAEISWWMGAKRVQGHVSQNQSQSVLQFRPQRTDDGKWLVCRAENPLLRDSAIEDKWRLVVQYAPVVVLKLGPGLRANDIREGDGVYFECHIQANPPAQRISWYHKGLPLERNATHVEVADQSLVLHSVSREAAGEYRCEAENAEGETASNVVVLRVGFAPVCSMRGSALLHVLKDETVTLQCSVEASPAATSYAWRFSSREDPSGRPTLLSEGDSSSLSYTPRSDRDYGDITCLAKNGILEQRSPCTFQVVPVDPPQAPQNCSLTYTLENVLRIDCQAGRDGGLPQQFHLQLLEEDSLTVVRNQSLLPLSQSPTSQSVPVHFELRDLRAGVRYRILVVAQNAKAASEAVTFEGVSVSGNSLLSMRGASDILLSLSPYLAGLAVLGVVIIGCSCCTFCGVRLRRRRRYKRAPDKPPESVIEPPLCVHTGALIEEMEETVECPLRDMSPVTNQQLKSRVGRDSGVGTASETTLDLPLIERWTANGGGTPCCCGQSQSSVAHRDTLAEPERPSYLGRGVSPTQISSYTRHTKDARNLGSLSRSVSGQGDGGGFCRPQFSGIRRSHSNAAVMRRSPSHSMSSSSIANYTVSPRIHYPVGRRWPSNVIESSI